MILETLKVGPMECNCSICVCPETAEAVIIDPGGDSEQILARVAALGAHVKYVLITHAHFDHVLAAGKIQEVTGATVCLHKRDIWLYRLMRLQYRLMGIKHERPAKLNRLLCDGETLCAGTISLRVVHTPGHSPGSSCYHCSAHQLLFAGDTLFRTSVGNWKLPFGSFESLVRSVSRLLNEIPQGTRVIPGHGDETVIGYERENNYFFKPEAVARLRAAERNRPGPLKTIIGFVFPGLLQKR